MKNIVLFVFLLIFPVLAFSQKAYESVYYKGSTQNITITFDLADGYIAASQIITKDEKTKKTSLFLPEDGVELPNKAMKFIHYSVSGKYFTDYFVLKGLENCVEILPDKINGKYYFKGVAYPFVLLKKAGGSRVGIKKLQRLR